MKDLYLRLGIGPDAGNAEIAAAGKADPDRAGFSAILLDAERREAYDRAFTALKTIGLLRSRLGLDSDQTWFREHCPDFVPALRIALTEQCAQPTAADGVAADAAEPQPAARSGPHPVSRRSWPWLVGLAVAAVVLAALAYLAN